MKFKIVVPTYNTEQWIARCLSSIYNQTYKNYDCVIINDASTDRTGQVIDSISQIKEDPRFTVIHNTKNVKALKNIVNGFNILKSENDPESVLMVIDGDDFLFSEYSLQIVAQAYQQYDPLLTYGNWVGWPDGSHSNNRQIPPEVHAKRNYRELPFAFSHLRTFKSKLWYNIKDEDLRDEGGKYFESGWDVAFMLPMIEMAGERTLYVPNVLYCYNRINPISDDKIRQKQQGDIDRLIRKKNSYKKYELEESVALYSKKYNLVFYNITKCAMTSISKSKQLDIKQVDINTIPSDAKTFCVLRNPFERAISSYTHIKKHDLPNLTVQQYVQMLVTQGFFDNHCLPQYYFLNYQKLLNPRWRNRKLSNVNYFINFNNIDEELSHIIGENIVLQRLNVNNSNKNKKLYNEFKKYESIITNLYQKDYELFNEKIINKNSTDPKSLLTPLRFDITAKTLYARQKLKGVTNSFHEDTYKHHLKVWNNFQENNPVKNSFNEFRESFNNLIDSIKNNGFIKENKIPIINNSPINGAHRIACGIVLNKGVYTQFGGEGQIDCSYEYFKNKTNFHKNGLEKIYSDAMAVEYVRNKKNTYIVNLFPSVSHDITRVRRIISKYVNIVYYKDVIFSDLGKYNYMHELYYGENWIGSSHDNYSGLREKLRLCFKDQNNLISFLVEAENLEDLKNMKNEIRKIYNIGNHSIHINDTYEETWRLASTLFNDNSIDFINNSRFNMQNYDRFKKQFNMLKNFINVNNIDIEDLCIDSSSVMTVYGIREGRDIDFLYHGNVETMSDEFSCHNNEIIHYNPSIDDIVYDPNNHFYFKGIKFAKLSIIKDMKNNRGESKDINDIALIDNFLKTYN